MTDGADEKFVALRWPDVDPEIRSQLGKPDFDVMALKRWLIGQYTKQTGENIDIETVTEEQKLRLSRWFGWQEAHSPDCFTFHKPNLFKRLVFGSYSGKTIMLSQRHCHICDARAGQEFEPYYNFSINIVPISRQAVDSETFRAFQAAIKDRLSKTNFKAKEDGRLCVSLTFVLSEKGRDKDLDNMTKALQDAVARALEFNDGHIHHLDVIKIIHEYDDEYVHLRIAPSALNDHFDVLAPVMNHNWAGQEQLDLKKYMKPVE